MSALAFHFILCLMVFTLVCACAGPVLFFASSGNPRRLALAKTIGGLAYIGMGSLGLLVFRYQPAVHLWLYLPFSAGLILLGVWMNHSGAKIRRALRDTHKES